MDLEFHSMKRKQLQALCKKYGIPANITNLEMANRLSSLLKETENPVASEQSSSSNVVVEEVSSEFGYAFVPPKTKKVRFSPENETFIFVRSEAKVTTIRKRRRRSTLKKDLQDSSVHVRSITSDEESSVLKKQVGGRRMSKRLKSSSAEVIFTSFDPGSSVSKKPIGRRRVNKKSNSTSVDTENVDVNEKSPLVVETARWKLRSRGFAGEKGNTVVDGNVEVSKQNVPLKQQGRITRQSKRQLRDNSILQRGNEGGESGRIEAVNGQSSEVVQETREGTESTERPSNLNRKEDIKVLSEPQDKGAEPRTFKSKSVRLRANDPEESVMKENELQNHLPLRRSSRCASKRQPFVQQNSVSEAMAKKQRSSSVRPLAKGTSETESPAGVNETSEHAMNFTATNHREVQASVAESVEVETEIVELVEDKVNDGNRAVSPKMTSLTSYLDSKYVSLNLDTVRDSETEPSTAQKMCSIVEELLCIDGMYKSNDIKDTSAVQVNISGSPVTVTDGTENEDTGENAEEDEGSENENEKSPEHSEVSLIVSESLQDEVVCLIPGEEKHAGLEEHVDYARQDHILGLLYTRESPAKENEGVNVTALDANECGILKNLDAAESLQFVAPLNTVDGRVPCHEFSVLKDDETKGLSSSKDETDEAGSELSDFECENNAMEKGTPSHIPLASNPCENQNDVILDEEKGVPTAARISLANNATDGVGCIMIATEGSKTDNTCSPEFLGSMKGRDGGELETNAVLDYACTSLSHVEASVEENAEGETLASEDSPDHMEECAPQVGTAKNRKVELDVEEGTGKYDKGIWDVSSASGVASINVDQEHRDSSYNQWVLDKLHFQNGSGTSDTKIDPFSISSDERIDVLTPSLCEADAGTGFSQEMVVEQFDDVVRDTAAIHEGVKETVALPLKSSNDESFQETVLEVNHEQIREKEMQIHVGLEENAAGESFAKDNLPDPSIPSLLMDECAPEANSMMKIAAAELYVEEITGSKYCDQFYEEKLCSEATTVDEDLKQTVLPLKSCNDQSSHNTTLGALKIGRNETEIDIQTKIGSLDDHMEKTVTMFEDETNGSIRDGAESSVKKCPADMSPMKMLNSPPLLNNDRKYWGTEPRGQYSSFHLEELFKASSKNPIAEVDVDGDRGRSELKGLSSHIDVVSVINNSSINGEKSNGLNLEQDDHANQKQNPELYPNLWLPSHNKLEVIASSNKERNCLVQTAVVQECHGQDSIEETTGTIYNEMELRAAEVHACEAINEKTTADAILDNGEDRRENNDRNQEDSPGSCAEDYIMDEWPTKESHTSSELEKRDDGIALHIIPDNGGLKTETSNILTDTIGDINCQSYLVNESASMLNDSVLNDEYSNGLISKVDEHSNGLISEDHDHVDQKQVLEYCPNFGLASLDDTSKIVSPPLSSTDEFHTTNLEVLMNPESKQLGVERGETATVQECSGQDFVDCSWQDEVIGVETCAGESTSEKTTTDGAIGDEMEVKDPVSGNTAEVLRRQNNLGADSSERAPSKHVNDFLEGEWEMRLFSSGVPIKLEKELTGSQPKDENERSRHDTEMIGDLIETTNGGVFTELEISLFSAECTGFERVDENTDRSQMRGDDSRMFECPTTSSDPAMNRDSSTMGRTEARNYAIAVTPKKPMNVLEMKENVVSSKGQQQLTAAKSMSKRQPLKNLQQKLV